jgi:Tol biopolymer transport system component
VTVGVLGLAGPASGAVDDLDLVSRNGVGVAGDDASQDASISADGRYVAFSSDADNLSTEDDNAQRSVFVRDLATGTTTLVCHRSAAQGGAVADDSCQDPAISADGRFVAFTSAADNLSTIDDNALTNVFVRDLQAQTTTFVSRRSATDGGNPANDSSLNPAISGDGRYVAFETFAGNLSTEDDGTAKDVFVRDLQARTTTLVSRQSAVDGGAGGDANSFTPAISADGRVVAFGSTADNLSAAAIPFRTDVFVRDLDAGTTTFVSRASGAAGAGGEGSSDAPEISADGRFVVFESDADNFSEEDDNTLTNVFVRDLGANATVLVSRADGPAGTAGDARASRPAISADGRYVAFDSEADNLSIGDDNAHTNVFVRDLPASTTKLVSRTAGPAGAGGDAFSLGPVISADGRYVAFESEADNLSTDDTQNVEDVFRRDVLGAPPTAPPAPGGTTTTASGVCKALPAPAPATPGDPNDITLTTTQLLINQRIDQAAIRRANGVQAWIDGGIEGRDLCQGSLGAAELAAGIVTDTGGAVVAFVAPDPRPIVVAPAKAGDASQITLSVGQLLINQRISQAAIRRLNGLKARMDEGLTGGDVEDRTLTQPILVSGLRVLTAPPPASPPAASVTVIAAATPGGPSQVTLSTTQILINQRISQAAVRRANQLIARIEDGLVATDVKDGSVTALDLAPGVTP